MAHHSFGEVITLDFPYSHHRSGKKRPALIISQDGEGNIVVARITSKQKSLPSDLFLQDWNAAGLNAILSSTLKISDD